MGGSSRRCAELAGNGEGGFSQSIGHFERRRPVICVIKGFERDKRNPPLQNRLQTRHVVSLRHKPYVIWRSDHLNKLAACCIMLFTTHYQVERAACSFRILIKPRNKLAACCTMHFPPPVEWEPTVVSNCYGRRVLYAMNTLKASGAFTTKHKISVRKATGQE